MTRRLLLALVSILPAAALAQAQAPAQTPPAFDIRGNYVKHEVMIPMRDGVRLFTVIYVPQDSARPHPFVMTRTPYGVGPYGVETYPTRWSYILEQYARDNYILVMQDVRGRWMSEGDFANVRPFIPTKTGPRDIDESSDTWDTIEWLIANVRPNNGRVGVRGTSYPGFYAAMAAIEAHPALKVASPQAPVSEWMGGDDFFHNGALLLSHYVDFFNGFGRPRPAPTSARTPGTPRLLPDGYEWYLRLGALSNLNPRLFHDSVAYWDSVRAHGRWDAWWQARSTRPHLRNLRPAMLWVGGWFDTENLWGALNAYAAAERQSPGAVNRLVMGPWFHGMWNGPTGDSLGAIAWGMPTARYFADSIEVPFFKHYLDDGPAPRAFEAAVFETGRNAWHYLDAWPAPGATPASWYLTDGGALTTSPPGAAGRAFDEYVSDPAHPVPYTAEITHWYNAAFMLEDQRFASRRADVLTYQSEPLAADVTVAGAIGVDFVVSTSGTDQDFVVKLIDVFPDDGGAGRPSATQRRLGGYQMLIRGDVMRGKFRTSTAEPVPFRPNVATPLRFTMPDTYHTFRAGHRIMVQVQSTWFPMVDRNPGRFMDIYQASDADFRPTTQRVYRSASLPSRIVLPVVR